MLTALGLSAAEQELYELLLSRAPVDLTRLRDIAFDRPWVDTMEAMLTSLEDFGLVAGSRKLDAFRRSLPSVAHHRDITG